MARQKAKRDKDVEKLDMTLVHTNPPFDDHDIAQAHRIVNWVKRQKDRERLEAGDRVVVARVERRKAKVKAKRVMEAKGKKVKRGSKK